MGFEQSFTIVSALVKNSQILIGKEQPQFTKTESDKTYLACLSPGKKENATR